MTDSRRRVEISFEFPATTEAQLVAIVASLATAVLRSGLAPASVTAQLWDDAE